MLDALVPEFVASFSAVPVLAALLRMTAALVLGGIVGVEREVRSKPAGLRTHMLVSIAACLFTLVGLELAQLDFGGDEVKRVDPLRLIEAVTAGVAFLAAGLIFTSGGKVRNITTGASLWMSGAIGLACGAGQIGLAALATVLTLVVIALFGRIERALARRDDSPP
ncbi:MgtC/SapB family protein [Palleronia sediminis]|uniref:Protein MgtC n=1 Tax=Palleronia sediminis TaxID=2547833 RepID=A0A4R6A7S3_9RHOB|nr:MgtC/SapB family protein [Palleronia sediminis]TDL79831.1 MgtC/SapB family protein [Palleronia sediminis]